MSFSWVVQTLGRCTRRGTASAFSAHPHNVSQTGFTCPFVCGQTTLVRQMQMHSGQEDVLDRTTATKYLQRNAIEAAQALVRVAKEKQIRIDDASAEVVLGLEKELTPDASAHVAKLWAGGLQEALRVNKTEPKAWVPEQAPFYLNNLPRIVDTAYEPTDPELLRTRTPTHGVHLTPMEIDVQHALRKHRAPACGRRAAHACVSPCRLGRVALGITGAPLTLFTSSHPEPHLPAPLAGQRRAGRFQLPACQPPQVR